MLWRQFSIVAVLVASCLVGGIHAKAQDAPPSDLRERMQAFSQATVETLPELVGQLEKELPDMSPRQANQLRFMALNSALRLKQNAVAKPILEVLIKEPADRLDSTSWRQALSQYSNMARMDAGVDVAKSVILGHEPDTKEFARHARWLSLRLGVEEPNQANALIIKELTALSSAAETEVTPSELAEVKTELMMALASRLTGEAAEQAYQEVADFAGHSVTHGIDSPTLLTQWANARTRLISLTIERDSSLAEGLIEKTVQDFEAMEADLGPNVTRALPFLKRNITAMPSRFGAEIARSKLIGRPAPTLEIDAVLGGTPVTLASLKGKVVLIDFWAVWCGPCIATFPHLRHLHETYSNDGLEILGVTNYYDYVWNEEKNGAERGKEVPAEEEQATIEKFAAKHELPYRLVVSPKESKNSKAYGITGIPQAVLIDRQGNIQMIRVGSGEQNAKALESKIRELLAN